MNINNINNKKIIVNTTNISEIKIPMIQRDYVQGLEENNNKLDRFLDALYNTINSNNDNDVLSLDFIYGNINKDGIFEPIDGQQRLTTLALLNFYFFCRQQNDSDEDESDKQNNTNLKNPFEHITYATRQSAAKFCGLLRDKDFIKHFKNNIQKQFPSSIINEYHKYFKEYNEDTTIISMLNTLDKIHEKFKNIKVIKYKNINKVNFKILTMNNFNLSDDLYIKMNGRGKQLSDFDNFKAAYFKWLENSQNSISELIPNNINIENLRRKFNTDYIDIFWDFAVENSNYKPDPEKLFFRFINRFVVGKYLLLTKKEKEEFSNEFERIFFDKDGIKSEKDQSEFEKIDIYNKILERIDNNSILTNNAKLINILDNLFNLKKSCKDSFKDILSYIYNPIWNDEKINIFSNNEYLLYKYVLIFNSISSYLEEKNIIFKDECNYRNIQTLKQISRIVWNISAQYNLLTPINKDTYKTVYFRLDFSKIKSNNIYGEYVEYLEKYTNTNDEKDNYIDIIVNDEQIKCRYINKNSKYEKIFIELESLQYLHGILGFLLNKNTLELQDNLIQISKLIFSCQKKYKLFIRALLSQIDNIDIITKNTYKSDNQIKQLIDKKEFRDNAGKILESIGNEYEIQNVLTNLINSYSHLKIYNINDYKDFTALCTHESLYREENNINKYKIHFTKDSYWLMEHNYVTATTIHMRSYCPIRYKLINGLKILSSTIKENNNIKYYTKRNECIDFCLQKKFNLKFELNEIYINDYDSKHHFSIHKFDDIKINNIDEKVLGLYDCIINYSKDFIELKKFFIVNKKKFKDIITNGNILCYTNPFEHKIQ